MQEKNLKPTIPTDRQNFLWNMIGSIVYAASSMVLSLVVIKVMGASEGGVFAIALTISQMFMYIAYFELRTFQVTDATDEFVFKEYHTAKIVLCILMLTVCISYILLNEYTFEKGSIVFLVCFLRFLDAYADVFEAQFQKSGYLNIAGKSLTYRTIIHVSILIGSMLITKHMIFSLVLTSIAGIGGIWYFDILEIRKLMAVDYSRNWKKIKKIIFSCFPLFIGAFCWTYILSASRIAIDGVMSSEFQAYYQIIFLPVSVISLFASFVFRPMLPRLSEDYKNRYYKEFYMFLLKGLLGISIITIICMVGAYLIGIPVLSFVSGCNLKSYRGILVFLILAGGFNAVGYNMYYVLTIMRRTKSVLFDYIAAAALAFAISSPMVKAEGIVGAAASFFIAVVVLCILFGVSIAKQIFSDRKKS